jgi:tetratricopeptide (TPR) repeat protein
LRESGGCAVHVRMISGVDGVVSLRDNWDAVYRADPEAHVFLSFDWVHGLIRNLFPDAMVLAASRSGGAPYSAFLPLRRRLHADPEEGLFTRLAAAGSGLGFYTGAITREDAADAAMRALGEALRDSAWGELSFDFLRMSEVRQRRLLEAFDREGFSVQEVRHTANGGRTDLTRCPSVELPPTWDGFIASLSSRELRRNLRRDVRDFEASREFSIEHATPETFERDIEALLELWTERWRDHYPHLAAALNYKRKMLRHCAATGRLVLPVVRKGGRPIAVQALLIDPGKRVAVCFIVARDESVRRPAIGLVLNAHVFRHAIEAGYRVLDLSVGDYDYKYTFGATDTLLSPFLVRRRTIRPQDRVLEPRQVPAALERAREFRRAGRLEAGLRCCRQILEVVPDSAEALSDAAWMEAALGRAADAEKTLRALLRLRPTSPELHVQLGAQIFRQGRAEQALEQFDNAMALRPDYPEAELDRATVLHTLGRLPDGERERVAAMHVEMGRRAGERHALTVASRFFRQAIAIAPDCVEAHFRLGETLVELGERDRAAGALRAALRLDPEHGEARMVLDRLNGAG